MITLNELRELIAFSLLEKLKGIFGVIDVYIAGYNETTEKLHWIALDAVKQEVIRSRMPLAPDLWENSPLEIPSSLWRGKGLIASAYVNKKIEYTSNAVTDVRSFYSDIFDSPLGLKSVLYIPLARWGFKGVLIVNGPKSPLKIGPIEISSLPLIDLERHVWKTLRETNLKDIVQKYFTNSFLRYLEFYNEVCASFDIMVLDKNKNESFLCLGEKVSSLLKFEEPPTELVSNFLHGSPGYFYIRKLKSLEDFITRTSLRQHYRHAFHVFCLGNFIINTKYIQRCLMTAIQRDSIIFKEQLPPEQRPSLGSFSERDWRNLVKTLWFIVSTCHDIGYPIQKGDKWIEEFFANWFHDDKIDFLVDRRKYFHLKEFSKYKNLLLMYLSEKLIKSNVRRYNKTHFLNLFSEVLDFKLAEYLDHAVLSAYLTMDVLEKFMIYDRKLYNNLCNKVGEKVMRFIISPMGYVLVGASILLHRFHRWKEYPYKEYDKNKNRVDECIIRCRRDFERVKSELPKKEAHRMYDLFEKMFISFRDLPFAFMLTFSDILQEWDRVPDKHNDIYTKKPLKPFIMELKKKYGHIKVRIDVSGLGANISSRRNKILTPMRTELTQFKQTFGSENRNRNPYRKFTVSFLVCRKRGKNIWAHQSY